MNKQQLKSIASLLPAPIHRWLGQQVLGDKYHPPVGMVNMGSMRRLTPISPIFGYDRGRPIDRYYVENFLTRHAQDIHGRVIEIGDAAYTRQFGGNKVTKSDVLHVTEGNPEATYVGDITTGDHVPSDTFDCFILTQTLQCIYDTRAALKTVHRVLKPGGVVLATVSGIAMIPPDEWGDYWCWSFTGQSSRKLFAEVFGEANVEVESFGNVLSAIAYLQGMAVSELHPHELDTRDPRYELTITIRAVKV